MVKTGLREGMTAFETLYRYIVLFHSPGSFDSFLIRCTFRFLEFLVRMKYVPWC